MAPSAGWHLKHFFERSPFINMHGRDIGCKETPTQIIPLDFGQYWDCYMSRRTPWSKAPEVSTTLLIFVAINLMRHVVSQ